MPGPGDPVQRLADLETGYREAGFRFLRPTAAPEIS
jgi:hypothetical protein